MNKKGKYSPEFKEQAVKRTLSGSFSVHRSFQSNRM
ncbi:transposase [Leptospira interrogans]